MYPHSFREELISVFYYDTLLVGHHNYHLKESFNDHEKIVIDILSRGKDRHVSHGDGFARSSRSS